jgi:hypothetical protein
MVVRRMHANRLLEQGGDYRLDAPGKVFLGNMGSGDYLEIRGLPSCAGGECVCRGWMLRDREVCSLSSQGSRSLALCCPLVSPGPCGHEKVHQASKGCVWECACVHP